MIELAIIDPEVVPCPYAASVSVPYILRLVTYLIYVAASHPSHKHVYPV